MATGAREIRGLVRQLLRHRGLLDNIYGNAGLTTVQCHAMIELEHCEMAADTLARTLNIDTANASRTLAILQNNGNVSYEVSPDNNQPLYKLTEQGKQRLGSHHLQINEEIDHYLAQLDNDEIEQLSLSLFRYNRAMEMTEAQKPYTVRDFEPADHAAMATIIARCLTEQKKDAASTQTDLQLNPVSPQSAYWVIVKQGKLFGGGGIRPIEEDATGAQLHNLYLTKSLRGKGFGRLLAVRALKCARKHGFNYCEVVVATDQTGAIALFQTLGFHSVEHADTDRQQVDFVTMRKMLR
ncbi:helix-turn-helix domain-containing GNAT family N-acetyltransferase [Veronia pacifica]|uniref:N-acetyltransferase domain-containing protein n=1 Tax=Veronia pacifica TaxID=1080227 RepID=A0A1C3EQ84_9GAMM|nr:helix-turn-helix domain-containing GNAT family N-acetyltransferase [Veronia pacifica]ODA35398.1 hypothetical protein A8L45_04355 [Veronia pacifica]